MPLCFSYPYYLHLSLPSSPGLSVPPYGRSGPLCTVVTAIKANLDTNRHQRIMQKKCMKKLMNLDLPILSIMISISILAVANFRLFLIDIQKYVGEGCFDAYYIIG